MNGYHGPFLTCIVRNEQHVKLAAAAQARLIRSARPDAGNLSGWQQRVRAGVSASWLLRAVHQCFDALGTGERNGKDIWPILPRKDAHTPKPRFSS